MVLLAATAGIIFLSTAVVLIVRAYLTAQSGEKNNNFSPLTYTNTEILEQNGELYTFSSATENPSTHKYSTTISKPAVVHNLEGKDKKPVYIRVAVKYNAYKLVVPDDPNAQSYEVNVTPDYPVTLSFTPGNGWERSLDDGYLYYSYVVVPGGSTDPVFSGDNVTLLENLHVLLCSNHYELDRKIDTDGLWASKSVPFNPHRNKTVSNSSHSKFKRK